jgi:hypothetical protein
MGWIKFRKEWTVVAQWTNEEYVVTRNIDENYDRKYGISKSVSIILQKNTNDQLNV